MTPVIPCSVNNISLIPGADNFKVRRFSCLTKCSSSRSPTKFASQRFGAPLRLFPQQYQKGHPLIKKYGGVRVLSATETDVATEEADSPVAEGGTAESSGIQSDVVKVESEAAPAQSQRNRAPRKSGATPTVKNEDLIVGAMFTGKVKSIQPFGAFVDIGAFKDGLVHVSKLSSKFVRDVGDIVSVGEEVQVRLIDVDTVSGRISLTMRDDNDTDQSTEKKDSPTEASDKPRPRSDKRNAAPRSNQRRNDTRSSKFSIGQELEGTVKSLARSGAFISLADGEEGFLPQSEEASEDLFKVMGNTSLQIGQQVKVRVLRIARGKATLTQKTPQTEYDGKSVSIGDEVSTNPFVLAFRQNKDIAAFLDQREKVKKEAEPVEKVEGFLESSETEAIVSNNDAVIAEKESESPEILNSIVNQITEEALPSVDAVQSNETFTSSGEIAEGVLVSGSENVQIPTAASSIPSAVPVEDVSENQAGDINTEVVSVSENSVSENVQIPTAASSVPSAVPVEDVSENQAGDISAEVVSVSENSVSENVQIPTTAEFSIPSAVPVEDVSENQAGDISAEVVSVSENSVSENVQIPTTAEFSIPSAAPVEDVSENLADATKAEVVAEISASEPENGVLAVSEEPEPQLANTNGSTLKENATKGAVSPLLVKQLREETGAGMMDCKKALAETEGDIVKAQEFLRKKGLASADKKSSRATAEGRIGSYIHDSRIGVLLEVNCETDFVSRGDIFKELVEDLAMQVAACPQVQYLATEDVPAEMINKEKEIEMQKEDLLSKPEQIREKIVEGRIRKRLEDLALLEQPYIKNDKLVIKDWIKQTIATIGENIKVKRFVRYNLGEGLEKKSQDFAAEVAAQTAAKSAPAPEIVQPAAPVEAEATIPKPAAVAVSAVLVKQLREETGAGMMDCKKALAETEGDLEKAQEYLRKKGLSTADKKSSRLAAEGRIGSYIHDSRIGVLIEVNCETDFVGRSEKFKELVDDLAMQVAACPQVSFVSMDEISPDVINKERELEMQREDLASKPENIKEKIVEGRVTKRLGELALLEQPFIKNDSLLVKDLVKQTVAALGENIKVRRFIRFTLGKTNDGAKVETATEA